MTAADETMVRTGSHGGVIVAHRSGCGGDWSRLKPADVRLLWEVVYTSRNGGVLDLRCRDCDSIVTGLRVPGAGAAGIGVTHSPGCPWLTVNAAL
jgi:hypothetical protein